VDGYSVVHAWPQLQKLAGRSLEHRRAVLVQVLERYGDHTGRRVTVVFDGYAARHKPELVEVPGGVEVVFSPKGKTADEVIERTVAQAGQRSRITVVTSDNVERQIVETLGAQTVSAEMFRVEVAAELRELGKAVQQHGHRSGWRVGREALEG
jgi:predicted RNA-binding protein with PIN domain